MQIKDGKFVDDRWVNGRWVLSNFVGKDGETDWDKVSCILGTHFRSMRGGAHWKQHLQLESTRTVAAGALKRRMLRLEINAGKFASPAAVQQWRTLWCARR